jgi:hypothetical protein
MATSGDRVRMGGGSVTGLGDGWSSRGLIIAGREVIVTDVIATAREGTVDNHGVSVLGSGITLTEVTATAESVPAADTYGVYGLDASFRMAGGVAEGDVAVYLEATSGSVPMVVLDHVALNGASVGLAVFDSPATTRVMVNNSSIRGIDNSIANIDGDVFVGGSQLAGGPTLNSIGGSLICAGVWDELYSFSPGSCL